MPRCLLKTGTIGCLDCRGHVKLVEIYRILFDQIEWHSPQPGVRFKVRRNESKQVRMVEFTSEFVEAEWCEKGHPGFVLTGELEVDFGGQVVRFPEGAALLIPGRELLEADEILPSRCSQ